MPSLPVRAYTDRLSYERGDQVSVHVSAADPVDVRLVRLISASADEPSLDRPVDWQAAARYDASLAPTCVGSFLHGDPGPAATASHTRATLGAFVYSGDVGSAPVQSLVSLASGPALQLRDGRPGLADPGSGDVLVTAAERLVDHQWHLVVGMLGPDGVRVLALPVDPLRGVRLDAAASTPVGPVDLTGPVTVAAHRGRAVEPVEGATRGQADDHFTGKVELPFVLGSHPDDAQLEALARAEADVRALEPVAAWDLAFSYGDDPTVARAVVPGQPDGTLVNGPARAVTGRTFTGRCLDFTLATDQYAAAHFHATDLVDAGWPALITAPLPEELESGVYGIVVENADGSDVVPISVVPRSSDERRKVAVVLPTFTYLAYANEALFNGLDTSAMTDQEVVVAPESLAHIGDHSFGLSMYDHHPDGSGVMLSAARRQIVNMRRGYRMWVVGGAGRAFSSDMYLIEWLARRGIEADVLTDHEVHQRGADYLRPYAAVVSGSHPEYTSEEMLDALTAYRDGGGGLLYLGGNGWYWVTGVLSDDPLVVEIRRGQAGVRCWESLPGEVTLMSTGLPGGLWRHRGRAPQALAGVGFAAQGWGHSEPYFRTEAAADPEHAWIFEGVDEEPIGAYGLVMDGAAGDEIDRADAALGTPRHAVVLATSRGHSNFYQRAIEEIPMNLPEHGGGEQDPEVHADIVYFATPGGGEVFSTGSIAWTGSLLQAATENGVSRMTENVIRAFVTRRRDR
ncbi:N,N-dimethylformamidase beta subunit family domain-containing protein [Streptosporangium sp. NPDC001681]|uniref:N,N-dimethylformamidase beta subunit family domain-containing protein n=1 Tax=Streptosporangium sp. NPDC001681 TaxID=3154395 RepID=UPI00331F2BD6